MHNNDLATAISAATDVFIRDITDLARRAAVQLVESTFGPTAGTPRAPYVASAALIDRLIIASDTPSTRGKRTAEDLDALCDKFASFVAANPGLRIEQINKKLGTKTKNLALPIRKLLASGRVKSKGQKRSTTYFPGKK